MPKEVTMWECDICEDRYKTEETASLCCQLNPEQRKRMCRDCDNNYYNIHEGNGCWSFSSARRVLKKEVPIDQRPPWNQSPIPMLSCFHQKGYVYVGPEQTH